MPVWLKSRVLNELLKIIEETELTSTSKAAEALGVTPDLVRVMLDDLQRMGFIRKISVDGSGCGGCHKCSSCTSEGKSLNKIEMWELVQK